MGHFRSLFVCAFSLAFLNGCLTLGKGAKKTAEAAEALPVRGLAALSSSVSPADREAFDEAVAAIKTGNLEKLTDSLPPQPEGSLPMLRFLNLRDSEHANSLLHIAVFEKHLPIIKTLVEKSAGESLVLNAINNYGETPLHLAVRTYEPPIVHFLLEQKNLKANPRNFEGETPMHASCRSESPLPIVKALAENGASPKMGNARNITPLAFCEYYQGGDDPVTKYLKQLPEAQYLKQLPEARKK